MTYTDILFPFFSRFNRINKYRIVGPLTVQITMLITETKYNINARGKFRLREKPLSIQLVVNDYVNRLRILLSLRM